MMAAWNGIMGSAAVRIEIVTVREMASVACAKLEAMGPSQMVPVTRRGALSCAHNPYADDKDVGLLLAYAGECCIGYLGLLPCLLKVDENLHKVYFLSQWYVDPAYRKTAAGALLLMRVLGLKYDLVMTGFSPEAEKVFQTKTFTKMAPLTFSMLHVDALNMLGVPFYTMGKLAERMGWRAEWLFHVVKCARGFLYPSLKRFLYISVLNGCRRELETIDIEPLERIEEDDVVSSSKTKERPGFYRGMDALNWMLEYPWYTEKEAGATAEYYFGEFRKLFRYLAVRVRDKASGERIGTVVMSVVWKNEFTVMTVLDLNVARPERMPSIAAAVLQYAGEYQADRVFLPRLLAPFVGTSLLLRRLLVDQNRGYYCCPKREGSALAPALDSIELRIEDGDCAFS
jgi:hypothetical protein